VINLLTVVITDIRMPPALTDEGIRIAVVKAAFVYLADQQPS
jgi:hypothetical protein